MLLPRRFVRLPVVLLPSLLAVSTASAFCGLQSCPRPPDRGAPPALEAGLRTRWVVYDIAGNEGSYVATAPRVFVRHAGFTLGVEVPLTRLDNGGAVATGFSNPVLMAQYARRLSYAWSGEAGVQLELPIGDKDAGLAGDHFMLLPWIGARRDFGAAWYAAGMAGISQGFGGAESSSAPLAKTAHEGHDHGAAPVLVNPHGDRELQGRLAAGRVFGKATVEAFALGRSDLTDGARLYLRAGASWERRLGRFSAVRLIADAPATAARRNELELGVALKTGW